MELTKLRSYSELIVWQKSMNLVEKIYLLTKRFPREEMYSLTDQIILAKRQGVAF